MPVTQTQLVVLVEDTTLMVCVGRYLGSLKTSPLVRLDAGADCQVVEMLM